MLLVVDRSIFREQSLLIGTGGAEESRGGGKSLSASTLRGWGKIESKFECKT